MHPYRPVVAGVQHVISAGHYMAAQAGFAILEAGGNAVDAGVAAGIALGVLQTDRVNFAGVAPIILYRAADRRVITLDGVGHWPRAADVRVFIERFGGRIPPGILRTVIPAAPSAWLTALEQFGTMTFAHVAHAAIRFARDGFPMHWLMAEWIAADADNYRRWPETAAVFLPDDQAPRVGVPFVQAELARTLQYMADQESAHARAGRAAGLRAAHDAFYRGDIAATIAAYHRAHEGWLTLDDLADYRVHVESPVHTRFRDIDLYGCGPWCQGPVLLEALNLVGAIDLRALGHNSPAYVHTLTEALKLAYADRHAYFGDPRFVDVPLDTLLSPEYAAARRRLIQEHQAWPAMPPAGDVPGGARRAGARDMDAPEPSTAVPSLPGDTSYVCAVDRHGNVCSATPSDVSWEGPVIPGTGFCPSSRGSQSWAVRGHPAALAPGKRPRLTPNPSLAIRRGKFLMPFGAPGGDLQPQGMLQVFLNHVVFGMPIQEAVEAPRFVTRSFPNSFEPHAYHPGSLDIERGVGAATGEALAALGHRVEWLPDLSIRTAGVCAIVADRERGVLWGGADPRRAARAMGW